MTVQNKWWSEYQAQAQIWSLKDLKDISILSVVGPTILEKRNEISFVHFAIYCDSLFELKFDESTKICIQQLKIH